MSGVLHKQPFNKQLRQCEQKPQISELKTLCEYPSESRAYAVTAGVTGCHSSNVWTGAESPEYKRGLKTKAVSSLNCKNRLRFNQKTIACKSVSLEVL